LQRQEHSIASAVIDEGRAFLVEVSANKMDLLLDLDGAEYTRQDFVNAVPEQELELRVPKSGGYGLGGKDNRKKPIGKLKTQISFVCRHCVM
jgi:hypothetical protein